MPYLGQKQHWINKKFLIISITLVAIFSAFFLFNSKVSAKKRGKINPAFASYISAHTAGSISRESAIRIQFTANFADSAMIGKEATGFSFTPNIKGVAYWIDAATVEFKPEEMLPSGQEYEAAFSLKQITAVPKELEDFEFDFSVIQQSFEVSYPNFASIDGQKFIYQRVSGTLTTADIEESNKVEELLQASQDGKSFNVKWEHGSNKKTHRYIIDSIVRKSSASEVLVQWNGNGLNLNLKGEHKLIIPAQGDFSAINARMENDGSQYISVYFSDPLMQAQDLIGLIHFDRSLKDENSKPIELKYIITGQEIKCYPNSTLSGTYQFFIEPGIQNKLGYKLKKAQTYVLNFSDQQPAVKILGKGVIIPASNKILMPFEAVGLNAVDVKITRIYEKNVIQFIQVNDLKGENEIYRVGKIILKKKILLNQDNITDLRKKNTYNLNLDELIKTEPGAIYQIQLSFKKEYALYRCDGENPASSNQEIEKIEEQEIDADNMPAEASFWDYSEEYYDENYRWEDRNNPCKNSYYNNQRWATRNIMASDLGIIAKRGSTNQIIFAITHLLTTKPIAGVTLEVLDYQQQVIATGTTNPDGMAKIDIKNKPFMVVAKFKEQRGYLKLDDGSSLSLSQFEVYGDVVQKGLKGLLYGERGVWRPGDSLYLTFMLEDKNKTLPKFHPVTLEIYTPLGALYKRQVQSNSLNGFYDFRTSTDPDAITGNYVAKVKVGGVTFQRQLKIETVMPNRLKIELNFPKPAIEKNESVIATLKSKWLHGAIAGGLNTKVEATLAAAPTQFKRYPDFVFDNPSRKIEPVSQTIFEGKLNEIGEVNFKVDFKLENAAAGMLNAHFVTKVFEPGGNFSVDRFSIPYHPYTAYIGLRMPKGDAARGMLLTDTTHSVQVVCVNPDGTNVIGSRKATARLYKINWRWWWDKNDNDISSYANSEEYSNIMEKEITLNNGIGRFNFKLSYPDWGRYLMLVTDEQGHSTGKVFYADWPGWAGRGDRDNSMEAAMLTFTLNKTSFLVGEKATLTIPTPQAGRALLSIESGTEVLETHWIEAQKGQTTYSFTINKNMLPNVYAHVTLVQPHAQVLNDLPIRMYGMMAIKVEDPVTKLAPVIIMASQISPDVNNTINISEANGKAMTYTLAVVDEGLLDLTRFKTPDPHSHFYAREALGVKTWDLYDYVMGAFGTEFNKILSIGGDEGINRKSGANKAKRFKPTVKFIGPFHLTEGKTNTHQININDYVGSVRVMVVAGYEGAYGFAEKAVPVKKPLMVLATLPRVLRPGEEVKLPVTVFAMDATIKQVNVQVTGNELVEFVGSNIKVIKFTNIGDEIVNFDLHVKKGMGIAKVKIVAGSGSERAVTEVELQVENPNPYENNIYQSTLETNKEWNISYELPGIAGTNTASLEVSTLPPINLEKRLKYLIQYPYGCVEQTTSAVFPQLGLNRLMELSDNSKNEIEKNIKDGIYRIKSFQNTDGGLGYWQGEQSNDEWGTNYAGHFMIEAQNAGYTLPINFLPAWKKFQQNKANNWVPNNKHLGESTQAYRLYTLALAKAPEMGAMNRLKEEPNLTSATRWRLAAAYVLAGNKNVALEIIKNEKITVANVHTFEMEYSYGSPERDEAMMLETLTLLDEKEKAFPLLQKVCMNLSSERWLSTQATAYSLLAIANLTGKYGEGKSLEFEYTLNGKTVSYKTKSAYAQIKLPITNDEGGKLNLKSKSSQLIFTTIITRGQPEIGKQTAMENGLKMDIVYKTMQDQVFDPSKIAQGTDFKVEVTITNPGLMGNYNYLALSQMLPSGWEIHNNRMDNNPTNTKYGVPRYQDIKDDRVYTHFDLAARQKVTYVLLLNASYLGKFYLPGFNCEAMYFGKVQARNAGKWVEVVPKN